MTNERGTGFTIKPLPSEYFIEGEGSPHLVDIWNNKKHGFWIVEWTNTRNVPIYEYLSRLQNLQDKFETDNPELTDPAKRFLSLQTDDPTKDFIDIKIDRFEVPDVEESRLIHARLDTEFFVATYGDLDRTYLALASHHNAPEAFTDFIIENSDGIKKGDLLTLLQRLTQTNQDIASQSTN